MYVLQGLGRGLGDEPKPGFTLDPTSVSNKQATAPVQGSSLLSALPGLIGATGQAAAGVISASRGNVSSSTDSEGSTTLSTTTSSMLVPGLVIGGIAIAGIAILVMGKRH
jgi:hypothetical protein